MSFVEHNDMITDTLDLSFFGVASIWNNDLGRLSDWHGKLLTHTQTLNELQTDRANRLIVKKSQSL